MGRSLYSRPPAKRNPLAPLRDNSESERRRVVVGHDDVVIARGMKAVLTQRREGAKMRKPLAPLRLCLTTPNQSGGGSSGMPLAMRLMPFLIRCSPKLIRRPSRLSISRR